MAFTWTEKTIELFKEASSYTGFHKQLAEMIIPYLNKSWSLCDFGCGLGFLDFAVSSYVKDITAIDISDIAVKDYRQRLAESGIKNIKVILSDVETIDNDSWDVVLLSFFGRSAEELDRIISMAEKLTIMVTYEELHHGEDYDSINKYKPITSLRETYLKDRGYKYELIKKVMDFGQPLKSIDEIADYHNYFSRGDYKADLEDRIKESMENVESTGNEDIPYFLPKKRDVGVFIIHM